MLSLFLRSPGAALRRWSAASSAVQSTVPSRLFESGIKAAWTKLGVPPEDLAKLEPLIKIGDDNNVKTALLALDDNKIAEIKKGDEGKTLLAAMDAVQSYYTSTYALINDQTGLTKKHAAIKALTQVVLKDTLQKQIGNAKSSVGDFTGAIAVLGQF